VIGRARRGWKEGGEMTTREAEEVREEKVDGMEE